jgi:transposase
MTALTDKQWQLLEPLLPTQDRTRGGRPRADDRNTLAGILWILKTGAQWSELPPKYGSYVTCWRRLKAWEEDGTWKRVWRTLLKTLHQKDKLSLKVSFLDGSFAPAKKGDQVWDSPRKVRVPNGWS